MARSVLVPLPDRDFDVTEVAVPWKLLSERGIDLVFATEEGAVAAADPSLWPTGDCPASGFRR